LRLNTTLELRYSLTLGGRLELFEELFEEAIGGDVASRFGSRPDIQTLQVKSTTSSQRYTLLGG
jgi:hypothetical protein